MQFEVLPSSRTSQSMRDLSGANRCLLLRDNWDDYSFKTSFALIYFDDGGTRHDIGELKIAQRGAKGGYTELSDSFASLSPNYASIGQGQEYYENIMALGAVVYVQILEA